MPLPPVGARSVVVIPVQIPSASATAATCSHYIEQQTNLPLSHQPLDLPHCFTIIAVAVSIVWNRHQKQLRSVVRIQVRCDDDQWNTSTFADDHGPYEQLAVIALHQNGLSDVVKQDLAVSIKQLCAESDILDHPLRELSRDIECPAIFAMESPAIWLNVLHRIKCPVVL